MGVQCKPPGLAQEAYAVWNPCPTLGGLMTGFSEHKAGISVKSCWILSPALPLCQHRQSAYCTGCFTTPGLCLKKEAHDALIRELNDAFATCQMG